MKNLRRNFEQFCYRNRSKGIPNLMLYIAIGTAVVYFLSLADKSNTLYFVLCFNRELILRGQIWRLFTYVFTYSAGNALIMVLSLFCYFSLGRAMENTWGTFRFNLFYLTGVLLMDVFCMLFGGTASVFYLNLSLLIGFATLYPNAQFLLFYIIPVRAWILGLFYLGITIYNVVQLSLAGYFPLNLFPLIAIANYFLFFGKDVVNVIPLNWRIRMSRKTKSRPVKNTGTIPFPKAAPKSAPARENYTHKCSVCGRTDVTNPELEFRYCSRCNGYHCYCEDHINNHTHIQ